MTTRIALKGNRRLLMLAVLFIAGLIFLAGCGDDYQKPSTTQTGSALISVQTLKEWMDAGKVNGSGYDRVVVLDVTSHATYTAGHVPGALFLDSSDISQTRTDGVAAAVNEIVDGQTIDELVQNNGIDGNTTIVFTGSSMVLVTRAYFTFRYWGFARNRLKLLDGLNTAWKSAYGTVSGMPPVPVKSTYSVKKNGVLRNDLRVSLAEMIDYADGKIPNAIPIDVRGADGSYAGVMGKTNSIFDPSGDFVVFEGRIRGAQPVSLNALYSTSTPTNTFKPADQLVAAFAAIGVDSTKTAYTYCKVGYQGAVGFFVLDGILGWPAALYDGSWSQWGQLSGNAAMKGQLHSSSPWRTDIPGRSDLIVYNYESVISAATSTATQNDLVTGGTFTGSTNAAFIVTIDSAGAPDTFSWIISGTTTSASGIPITGSSQELVSGVTVSFGAMTGHAVDDSWTFTATAGKNVEQLTLDGTECSASFLVSGSITNSSGGTTACTNQPDSFDNSANRIEEEDEAYMKSGGAGGSTGGGAVAAGC